MCFSQNKPTYDYAENCSSSNSSLYLFIALSKFIKSSYTKFIWVLVKICACFEHRKRVLARPNQFQHETVNVTPSIELVKSEQLLLIRQYMMVEFIIRYGYQVFSDSPFCCKMTANLIKIKTKKKNTDKDNCSRVAANCQMVKTFLTQTYATAFRAMFIAKRFFV